MLLSALFVTLFTADNHKAKEKLMWLHSMYREVKHTVYFVSDRYLTIDYHCFPIHSIQILHHMQLTLTAFLRSLL